MGCSWLPGSAFATGIFESADSALGSFANVQTSPLYFDRADVKAALHAPPNKTWSECSAISVFQAAPNGQDESLPPALTVLPSVIENSERSVIVHGLADFVLIAEGARIVLQNMTWGGVQGFQNPLSPDSFVIDGLGAYGTMQSERKLTYYEVSITGHMVPQYSPWVCSLTFTMPVALMVYLTGRHPKYAVFDGIQAESVKSILCCISFTLVHWQYRAFQR